MAGVLAPARLLADALLVLLVAIAGYRAAFGTLGVPCAMDLYMKAGADSYISLQLVGGAVR